MTARDLALVPAIFALAAMPALFPPTFAQSSTNYRLTESSLNAGGEPNQGSYATSAHHRLKLDTVGEAIVAPITLSSTTQRMDAGLAQAYPPPGEVLNLAIDRDKRTLRWRAERSVGCYNLYRGLITTLPGSFGSCLTARVLAESWVDSSVPPARNGYFYLVTAKNRLDEEGPKGYQSSGAEEPNPSPCP